MLYPIAITAYKRPHYLKQTLDSLKISYDFAMKQDSSLEFILVASLEPGYNETLDVIKSVDFMPIKLHVNDSKLGLNANVFMSINRAFEISDVVIGADEDVHYSEDFLWFCVSMLRTYKDDQSVLHITIANNNFNDINTNHVARKYGEYQCGTITWKDRWQWFSDNWLLANGNVSYDYGLSQKFPKDKCGIYSVVQRARHLGMYGGTYSLPQMWSLPEPILAENYPPVTKWIEVS